MRAWLAALVVAAGCGAPAPRSPDEACAEGARRCELDSPAVCAGGQWKLAPACEAEVGCDEGFCRARSCLTAAPGADGACADGRDCCASSLVPGGTFLRGYDGVEAFDTEHPATVSSFRLDDLPVTVGRFRNFIEAGYGIVTNPPALGAGALPGLPESGWTAIDTLKLLATSDALAKKLWECAPATYTQAPGLAEKLPVACVDWAMAFSFCVWDGGRLPTEAELAYAEAGGDEQRYFPWSDPARSTRVTEADGVFLKDGWLPVGAQSSPGRWGQLDLGGNVWSWVLDRYGTEWPMPCIDCVELQSNASRRKRGGSSWQPPSSARAARASGYDLVDAHEGEQGFRCVREMPAYEP